MTEEQKQAVLARDLNRCIALGGNIYFLAKIGATDGKSFQQMAGSMTGMSEEEYRDMMVERRPLRSKATAHDRGRRSDGPHHRERLHLARAGRSAPRSTSARPHEPYWQPVFEGYEFSKQWLEGAQAGRRSSWSTTITPPPSAST